MTFYRALQAGLWADWFPAVLGAVSIWLVTAALAGQGLFGTLTQSIAVASFLALVGFGQLMVITLGRGNIDLSVPYVLTLSAYVSSWVMDGVDTRLIPALALALSLGALIGAINFLVIRFLAIPPLIGTLAIGFIVQTCSELVAGPGAKSPSPIIADFAVARFLGISVLAILVILLGVAVHFLLIRSVYGRRALAAGQSAKAARFAGINVDRGDLVAYVICGTTAALCGVLLAAYAQGPSLDMAAQYQLGSIAVVVLGGTSIGGGRSNVVGVWWAALMLTLLTILMSIVSAGPGIQRIVEGLVIVGILAIVRGKPAR